MASFIKTLAIAAGAGVAFGLCTTAGSRRAPRREAPRANSLPSRDAIPVRDPIIDIEPLLDRLESIERKFAAPAAPVAVSELTSRIDAQQAEIERLRDLVDVRAAEIQSRLEAEMDARHRTSMAAVEKAVEFKVSERIAALERAVGEQSVSLDALRTRAQDTDANLQRLIVAIEKLCERTPLPAPVPQSHPIVLPFEAHLNEAREREEVAVPEFRAKIFREMEAEPEPVAATGTNGKKSRFPLTRIFGMLAIFVMAQFLS
jgi:uncharacterized coiled-coil protein SlyX